MSTENYKNVIIGSGEGGKYLTWHLAQSGQQTAVVDRRWIGGSCPNVNCLPSKNEIWSAKANLVYHAGKFGSTVSPAPIDMAVVRRRKGEMVQGLIDMPNADIAIVIPSDVLLRWTCRRTLGRTRRSMHVISTSFSTGPVT
jgi:pyruvate/2-oxoglutarate dehydrogenase complex dihydrolipoamide dehydrogenase (E3) component